MCVARGEHASRDQIPAPAHTGGAGLPVRRLARVLVGRLGQTPHVLHRDGGESEKLSRNAREKITIPAARRTSLGFVVFDGSWWGDMSSRVQPDQIRIGSPH